MSDLLALFGSNILPVFLIGGAGYLLARWSRFDLRPISQLIFHLFTPALVFNLLVKSTLSAGDVLRTALFVCLLAAGMGLAAWLVGRVLRFDRQTHAAVALAAMFMNAGNFGLPVVLFAFGEQALAYATVFFLTSLVLTLTVGVLVASHGGANGYAAETPGAALRHALGSLARLPALYALALALLIRAAGWTIPLPVARSVELLSGAAIPTMLALLGMQLHGVRWDGQMKPLWAAVGLRLLTAPALAFALSLLLGFSGPSHQAAVLESAMPVAVMTTILAMEYNLQPTLVTMVVFVTTLLSPLTLTPLIAYLGG